MRAIPSILATLSLSATMALALPGLPNEEDINDGLLAVGIADEIRKNCPSISGRVVKAILFMNSLEKLALSRGYSEDQIEAYVNSDAEKAKMRAKGEEYLATKGVNRANPETFCDLGRAEIASGSQIGSFLRAK